MNVFYRNRLHTIIFPFIKSRPINYLWIHYVRLQIDYFGFEVYHIDINVLFNSDYYNEIISAAPSQFPLSLISFDESLTVTELWPR